MGNRNACSFEHLEIAIDGSFARLAEFRQSFGVQIWRTLDLRDQPEQR